MMGVIKDFLIGRIVKWFKKKTEVNVEGDADIEWEMKTSIKYTKSKKGGEKIG